MKRWSFWILTGLVLLVISVAGAKWLLNSGPGEGGAPTVAKLPGLNPRSTTSATCIGLVDVESRVLALSLTQPGRVDEIPVKEEQEVKAGQVLLRLDDRPAQYTVQQAQADVKAAEAQLEELKKLPQKHRLDLKGQAQAIEAAEHKLGFAAANATRQRNLQKKLLAGDEEAKAAEELQKAAKASLQVDETNLKKLELIDPESEIKRAEADLEGKKAKLSQAQYVLTECNLVAPMDGRILRILIGRGELVTGDPKQPVIQFAPREPRIVRAEVEQEFAGRVSLGQPALVEDDSHADIHWKGKVVRISDWYTPKRNKVLEPLQFNDVRTLECVIQLDAGQKDPRIGQRVRVTMESVPAK